MRWTTGIGIALGGAGGAIAALMGAPSPTTPGPDVQAAPTARTASPAESDLAHADAPMEAGTAPAEPAAVAPSASSSSALSEPVLVEPTTPAVAVAAPGVAAAPALAVPTTRAALLKAELYCDKRKDFDECTRAAQALETGTAGPADPEQAKRFRRIALTHLVAQCESGSAHACFVLAAKYRAGTELAKNDNSALALEKRAGELCRLGRRAPECP